MYRAKALEGHLGVEGGLGAPGASDKPAINKQKKNPTGYQLYVSEVMKMGVKMAEAATRWKELEASAQQTYKDKSSALALASRSSSSSSGWAEGDSGDDMKNSKKASDRSSGSAAPETKRNPSGYQLYTSQVTWGGGSDRSTISTLF